MESNWHHLSRSRSLGSEPGSRPLSAASDGRVLQHHYTSSYNHFPVPLITKIEDLILASASLFYVSGRVYRKQL